MVCSGTTCDNDNTTGAECSQGSFESKATMTTAFLLVKQATRVKVKKGKVTVSAKCQTRSTVHLHGGKGSTGESVGLAPAVPP